MKIKILGFKSGVSRPTCNKTLDLGYISTVLEEEMLGKAVCAALDKSDFLSIRRVI